MSLKPLVFTGLAAFAAGLVLTPLAGRLAARLGMVAKPRPERWGDRPIPLLGGLAVFLAYLAPLPWVLGGDPGSWGIVTAGACMLVLGLWDDSRRIGPQTKLVCQIVGACVLTLAGIGLKLRPAEFLNVFASIFWAVVVMNAVNLMDNMDGLAPGVSLIASLFILAILLSAGATQEACLAAALAGALGGFLVFNFPPASIFLGDAGSLSIGVTLAGLTLSTSLFAGQKLGAGSVLLVPALIMAIPILDVVLVAATRILGGRPVSQGGRDHTSHRLVEIGLSERRAVLLLYGFSAVSGLAAILAASQWSLTVSLMLVPFIWVGLGLFFVYLAHFQVGWEDRVPVPGRASMILGLAFKRQVLEVVMDLGLAFACFCSAYLLRFDFVLLPLHRDQVLTSLPWVLAITLVAFQRSGLYRDLWQHFSLRDVYRFAQASLIASVACLIFAVLLTRFEGYPRSVFPLYGILLFIGVTATRGSFRLLDAVLARDVPDRIPVLIYDTGDLGEAAFLEITGRRKGFLPVGFLDDDPTRRGLGLHGLPIFGAPGQIEEIGREVDFNCIVVAKAEVGSGSMEGLLTYARGAGKKVLRFKALLEEVTGPNFDTSDKM